MLAVVTEVTVKLVPKPELSPAWSVASFDDVGSGAGDAVAAIIAAGIIPAGLEMMDKPATRPADPSSGGLRPGRGHPALQPTAPRGVAEEIDRVGAVLAAQRRPRLQGFRPEAERQLFWAGRKAVFPAVGRITLTTTAWTAPFPGNAWPKCSSAIAALEKKYRLRCANVFHAGDGNLHPSSCTTAVAGEWERAEAFGAEILELSVALGGRSPANTASGSRKSTRCASSTGRPNWRPSTASRRPSTPGPAQPRQGRAQPAPLRRIRAPASMAGRYASRAGAFLMAAHRPRRTGRRRAGQAAAERTPLLPARGGSKGFLRRPPGRRRLELAARHRRLRTDRTLCDGPLRHPWPRSRRPWRNSARCLRPPEPPGAGDDRRDGRRRLSGPRRQAGRCGTLSWALIADRRRARFSISAAR